MTPSLRTKLIRLAASMPKDSRQQILDLLRTSSQIATPTQDIVARLRKVVPARWRIDLEDGKAILHRPQCSCTIEIFSNGNVRTLHRCRKYGFNVVASGPFDESNLVLFINRRSRKIDLEC